MAVEKIYQPYDEATQTSIPQRQPQSSPEKQTVKSFDPQTEEVIK